MVRLIASIVGGLVLAFCIVFAVDALSHAAAPDGPTPPADMKDKEALRAYVAAQPVWLLVSMTVGWAIAAFAGSAVAARFGGRGAWPGWLVAALFLAATASNLLLIPHPAWMVAVGITLVIAAGWLGTRIFAARRLGA